jgi:hypothetical protein
MIEDLRWRLSEENKRLELEMKVKGKWVMVKNATDQPLLPLPSQIIVVDPRRKRPARKKAG